MDKFKVGDQLALIQICWSCSFFFHFSSSPTCQLIEVVYYLRLFYFENVYFFAEPLCCLYHTVAIIIIVFFMKVFVLFISFHILIVLFHKHAAAVIVEVARKGKVRLCFSDIIWISLNASRCQGFWVQDGQNLKFETNLGLLKRNLTKFA